MLAAVTAAVIVPYTQDAGSVAIIGLNGVGRILATINRAIEIKAAESEKPREPRRVQ